MDKRRCLNCSEYRRCKEDTASWMFFIIGLVATIAIRAVTVLVHIKPTYGQIAWYVGVLGFLVFFVYKFKVEHARSRLIKESRLIYRIMHEDAMEKGDRALVSSLLCSISSGKDKINYFVIFASSAIAVAVAVYLDFFR